MPQIKSKRLKRFKSLRKKHTSKDILNKISWIRLLKDSSPSVSSKKNISHTKGHYGWKNLNQISNEESNLGRLKRTKVQKHQKNAKGMGMRNKRIYLFAPYYNPMVSMLEAV